MPPTSQMGVDSHPTLDPTRWVENYGDFLYGFALARVRAPDVAQDLVQDTLLAAWRGRAVFGGRSSERTWLTGILKHKIMDHYRTSGRTELLGDRAARGREHGEVFDEDGHWLIDQPSAPREWEAQRVAALDRDEFWACFRACADQLPEQTRRVFLLREVDGMDGDEVCRALRISPNNFWVIMHRARAALRRCLELNWFARA